MRKLSRKTLFTCRAAIFAALYAVLTAIAFAAGLANNPIQIRVSEALCVLPLFYPEAVIGVTLGCLISNIFTGCIPIDIVGGTAATLVGALGAYLIGKAFVPSGKAWKAGKENGGKGFPSNIPLFLAPLPTIFSNTLILPAVMKFGYGFDKGIWYFVLTIGIGEFVSAGVLGVLLLLALKKRGLPE